MQVQAIRLVGNKCHNSQYLTTITSHQKAIHQLTTTPIHYTTRTRTYKPRVIYHTALKPPKPPRPDQFPIRSPHPIHTPHTPYVPRFRDLVPKPTTKASQSQPKPPTNNQELPTYKLGTIFNKYDVPLPKRSRIPSPLLGFLPRLYVE